MLDTSSPLSGATSAQADCPDITFVCCIEAGSLEAYTVRMIESLRRWGGRFANAPLVAVTPRFGPPLAKATREILDRYNVEYLQFQARTKYGWNRYLNKPNALVAVEERSQSAAIGWLDSDLLFLGEPDQLFLQENEDFLACASDRNIGTQGEGDPFEPYWQEICRQVGINIEELPWVVTEMEGMRIRLYWNSGLFVYRRSTEFSKKYLEMCLQLLDGRIANHNSGIFFTDQVALGLTMFKMGLTWRALPHSHNFNMSSLNPEDYRQSDLEQAKINHHHDCMWPKFWSTYIDCMQATHPEVAEWLQTLGPLQVPSAPQWRLLSRSLRYLRTRKEQAYTKTCRVI